MSGISTPRGFDQIFFSSDIFTSAEIVYYMLQPKAKFRPEPGSIKIYAHKAGLDTTRNNMPPQLEYFSKHYDNCYNPADIYQLLMLTF